MLSLAFKFIRYDRAKSIGIITAIVISIFLIGQQLGLMFYLMGLMGNLVGNAPVQENELWVIEGQSNNMNAVNHIDRRLVQQIGSMAEIAQTYPVLLVPARATFLDGKTASVTLVAADAPSFVMGPTADKILEGDIKILMQPRVLSAEIFAAKSWNTDIVMNKSIEINGKSAKIGVITQNAQTFGSSVMYTSMDNARILGDVSPSDVSIIVAKLRPDADKQQVIRNINTLYPSLRAWDVRALQKSTVSEILSTSNMGMSFGTLVLFAMISGFFYYRVNTIFVGIGSDQRLRHPQGNRCGEELCK
jgi:putative ABC transport system permease protein